MNYDIVLIYVLIDPNTHKIRYVGKTVNLPQRLDRHRQDALSAGATCTHRNAWLKSLYVQNLAPHAVVVEETTLEDWGDRERYYIQYYRSRGCPLTNMTVGGPGVYGYVRHYKRPKSERTKEQLRKLAKDRWASGKYDFHRQSLRAKYGDEVADAHHDRMVEYNANRVVTQETKNKISAVQSQPIVLVDEQGNICYTFENARVAGEALGCGRSNVNNRRRIGGKLLDKYTVHFQDEYMQHNELKDTK